jgi:hypothetical protein
MRVNWAATDVNTEVSVVALSGKLNRLKAVLTPQVPDVELKLSASTQSSFDQ